MQKLQAKLKITSALSVLLILSAHQSSAGSAEACIRKLVTISVDNIRVDIDAVAFELMLTNNTNIDIGGAIIRQELWAEGRPTALSESYSQSSHTIRGGLLAGETTTFIEYIGLHDRELMLATGAPSLLIKHRLENVADIHNRKIGETYDPFALWSDEASKFKCDDIINPK